MIDEGHKLVSLDQFGGPLRQSSRKYIYKDTISQHGGHL